MKFGYDKQNVIKTLFTFMYIIDLQYLIIIIKADNCMCNIAA